MRIAVGSDHAGIDLKRTIAEHLRTLGHDVVDLGTHGRESTDYPDYAHKVAEAVVHGDAERGVLVCGTGQGMAIAANKVPGCRAAVVCEPFSARMAAAHNDAQVLCVGQRVIGEGVALACVDAWLGTPFEGGRHERRVQKMEPMGERGAPAAPTGGPGSEPGAGAPEGGISR
jgi:ribose 5-phosphate isomerase B